MNLRTVEDEIRKAEMYLQNDHLTFKENDIEKKRISSSSSSSLSMEARNPRNGNEKSERSSTSTSWKCNGKEKKNIGEKRRLSHKIETDSVLSDEDPIQKMTSLSIDSSGKY